jgi:hypothetical protein
MLALVAAVAALIALVVAMLAVPLVLFIDAERTGTLKVRWRVFWLFGLVRPRSRNRSAPPVPDRADARRAGTPKKSRARKGRVAVAVLRTRGLLQGVVRLALALLRRVKVERIQLDALFGFENPADTGFVYGCLSPVLVIADVRGLNIRCRPMFLEAGVRGAFRATIQVRPLSIVGPMIAFLVSPAVFRAVHMAWRTRQ